MPAPVPCPRCATGGQAGPSVGGNHHPVGFLPIFLKSQGAIGKRRDLRRRPAAEARRILQQLAERTEEQILHPIALAQQPQMELLLAGVCAVQQFTFDREEASGADSNIVGLNRGQEKRQIGAAGHRACGQGRGRHDDQGIFFGGERLQPGQQLAQIAHCALLLDILPQQGGRGLARQNLSRREQDRGDQNKTLGREKRLFPHLEPWHAEKPNRYVFCVPKHVSPHNDLRI